MTTYPGLPGPVICDFLSREASREMYAPGVEFQIGKIEMVANTGTYVDSPFHRYADGNDLSGLPLESLADLDAVVVRAPGLGRAISPRAFEGVEIRAARGAGPHRLGRALGHRALPDGQSVPHRGGGRAARRRRRGAGRDRLAQHRRPRRPRAAGALDPARRARSPSWSTSAASSSCPTGFRFSAVPAKVAGFGTWPVRAYAATRALTCRSARPPSPAFPPSPSAPTNSKRRRSLPRDEDHQPPPAPGARVALAQRPDPARRRRATCARSSRPGDSGGWDECFPTVAPSPMPGAPAGTPPLPDHGELWSAPWTSSAFEHAGNVTLTASATGRLLPYEFHRELTLDAREPVVRLRYRLRHTGDAPFPWIWSAHPLLNVQPGTTLELPTMRQVRVDAACRRGRPDARRHRELARGVRRSGRRSSPSPRAADGRSSCSATSGASGRMTLTDPRRGERLEMVVRPEEVPQVGTLDQLRRLGAAREDARTTTWVSSPASARPTGWRTRCGTGARRRRSPRARSGVGAWRWGCRRPARSQSGELDCPAGARAAPAACPPTTPGSSIGSRWVSTTLRWHRRSHPLLDLLQQVVTPLHRPASRHQDVERDEPPGARLAGAERVVAHAVRCVRVENPLDLRQRLLGKRGVEQSHSERRSRRKPANRTFMRHGDRRRSRRAGASR